MNDVIQELIQKTYQELSQTEKPKARSRVWKSTNGYIFLVSWSNASLLRVLVTRWFDWQKGNKGIYRNLENYKEESRNLMEVRGIQYINRLEGQLLDAIRSVIANQEEGFARPTTSSYLDFIGYSQASLKEVKGEVQRIRQDGFIKSIPGSKLSDLGINLGKWHEILKKSVISVPVVNRPLRTKSSRFSRSLNKGTFRNLQELTGRVKNSVLQEPLNSYKFNYPPVDKLDPSKLTYEMIIELINKTDWNLRKLVESLEKKLNQESKYYQVEKARINDKVRGY